MQVTRTIGSQMATTTTDARGLTISTSLNGFDGTLIQHDTIYDILGRRVVTTRPYFSGATQINATHDNYDSLDRLETALMPDGTVVTHTYPSMFETHVIDPGNNGHKNESSTIASVDGQVMTSATIVIVPNEPKQTVKTSYRYGAFGVLEQVTDDAKH